MVGFGFRAFDAVALVIAIIGCLLWLIGGAAWLTYLFGRLLGAESWQEHASSSLDRWRIAADLSGDSMFTLTDAVLWGGWLAYLPGNGFIGFFLGSGMGALLEVSRGSFGGAVSAVLSLFWWFGISAAMIAAAGDETDAGGT